MNLLTPAYMILDLQYGSTGKGSLAGYLAMKFEPDVIVTAWAPNAGHTYIDKNGREFIHRMLANGIVSPRLKKVLIGAGSVVDPECLLREIRDCKEYLVGKHIIIHPRAAIVLPKHLEQEKKNVTIGSTMKGSGAALIQKIQRNPMDTNIAETAFPREILEQIQSMGVLISIDADEYRIAFTTAETIQIEGAQGYSLSIHHGLYPYCTSRDVTPAQVMADCCIPYGIKPLVFGTLRTFPIRVANRYNENGEMIGTSGGCYPDQKEIEWGDIGIEPELTTVTKLPRRVFSFSMEQTKEACFQCEPDALFLNFVNYISYTEFKILKHQIEGATRIPVKWFGVGAGHDDILEHDTDVKSALESQNEK